MGWMEGILEAAGGLQLRAKEVEVREPSLLLAVLVEARVMAGLRMMTTRMKTRMTMTRARRGSL